MKNKKHPLKENYERFFGKLEEASSKKYRKLDDDDIWKIIDKRGAIEDDWFYLMDGLDRFEDDYEMEEEADKLATEYLKQYGVDFQRIELHDDGYYYHNVQVFDEY